METYREDGAFAFILRVRYLTVFFYSQIDYVFQELEGYAAIRDPSTDIQLASFERIWRSDSLITPSLRNDLLAVSALLESSSPPDWHPGSDGKVLDLVHPSLYPIVYGRTHA